MAQLRCLCERWNVVGGDVRFCVACGRPLGVEDFQELIELDDAASSAYVKVRGTGRDDLQTGFSFMILAAILADSLKADPRVQIGVMLLVLLAFVIMGPILRRRARNRVLRQYANRLWSKPARFRPSIPKL